MQILSLIITLRNDFMECIEHVLQNELCISVSCVFGFFLNNNTTTCMLRINCNDTVLNIAFGNKGENIIGNIKKCRCRRRFNFIRIGGKYHADIEAASQEDLGIIYDICNNDLSWDRRPAYVQINDNLFIAASYSAFPHGESSENFGGHICLHFKNSKTHGTTVKDLEHQKSISKAYKQRDNIEKYL